VPGFSATDIPEDVWSWLSSNWARTIAILLFIPAMIMFHEDTMRQCCVYHEGMVENQKFIGFDCVGIEDRDLYLSYIQTISRIDTSKIYVLAAYFLVIMYLICKEIMWRDIINENKSAEKRLVTRIAQGSKPVDIFRVGSYDNESHV